MNWKKLGKALLYPHIAVLLILLPVAVIILVYAMISLEENNPLRIAAYTFTSLTMAIINVIKYRKYNSPVFSVSKAISLAAACVPMLTLENTMLVTFRDETMTPQTQRLFLSLSGGVISIFIVVMAIYMITRANQKIKCLENEDEK